MKPESKDSGLRSGRNPCFRISKIPKPNLGENEEQFDLNGEINYLNLI